MEPWTGVKRLGLGTWKLPASKETADIVFKAIQMGYRHIDCASVYGNQKFVGEGIKRALSDGIVKREDLWITSKLWNTDHAKEHVEPACRRSLDELNLDYLDLYLIHFPVPLAYVPPEKDPAPGYLNSEGGKLHVRTSKVPLSETWACMEKLVQDKLTRHIGVSNFDLQLLSDLLTYCKIRPFTNQVETHLFLKQAVLLRWCEQERIFLSAYSPLGAESYYELDMVSKNEVSVLKHPLVVEIAKNKNRTPAQVALQWLFQRSPWTVALVKTKSAEHAKENLEALNFTLAPNEMEQLSSLDVRRRYNDPITFTKGYGFIAIHSE